MVSNYTHKQRIAELERQLAELLEENKELRRHTHVLGNQCKALREAVNAFTDLMNESEGVCGLHLNGDLAPWSELQEGGACEDWLLPLSALKEQDNG